MTITIPAPIQDANTNEAFTLEGYFCGKSVARGIFVSKIGNIRREFDVYLDGEFEGNTLTLREDFVFADGETDRKTWIFEKISNNQYVGTREGVVGTTTVIITYNVARFSYLILLPRPGKKPVQVRFRDKMILEEDGLLLNRAKVSKFGLPVAQVAVNFRKGSNMNSVAAPNL